jgi:hypothetical protein
VDGEPSSRTYSFAGCTTVYFDDGACICENYECQQDGPQRIRRVGTCPSVPPTSPQPCDDPDDTNGTAPQPRLGLAGKMRPELAGLGPRHSAPQPARPAVGTGCHVCWPPGRPTRRTYPRDVISYRAERCRRPYRNAVGQRRRAGSVQEESGPWRGRLFEAHGGAESWKGSDHSPYAGRSEEMSSVSSTTAASLTFSDSQKPRAIQQGNRADPPHFTPSGCLEHGWQSIASSSEASNRKCLGGKACGINGRESATFINRPPEPPKRRVFEPAFSSQIVPRGGETLLAGLAST